MKVLKNTWTLVMNVGWVAALLFFISQGHVQTPEKPVVAAELPASTEQTPLPAKTDKPSLVHKSTSIDDILADIQAEADQNKTLREELERAKEEAASSIPEPPPHREILIVPHATPNLHETHEDGETYTYSLARLQNNELRWTINEFHWRLNDKMQEGKKFWDLSDIDGGKITTSLPKNIDDLREQNWKLSWRASRLADMMNGKKIIEAKTPPMPKGTISVPIPRPSCNSDFCRIPQPSTTPALKGRGL